ncbi:MAG: hypothetical protein ABL882_11930 [Sphingopyxis sp.]
MNIRTVWLLPIILLLPFMLTALRMHSAHQDWAWANWIGRGPLGAWAVIGVTILLGASPIKWLDWQLNYKVALTIVYVSVMPLLIIWFALLYTCAIFGDCL